MRQKNLKKQKIRILYVPLIDFFACMGLNNKRPRYLNYSVNKKGPKSGNKIQKAVRHYEWLLKRKESEGETKWIRNALEFARARLKKYSIHPENIA